MRLQRQVLPLNFQTECAKALDAQVATCDLFLKSKRIAAYCAHQGEIDPRLIIQRAWSMGKCCFLPILHPLKKNSLWFIEYTPDTPLIANRFGILEPERAEKKLVPAWSLDLVLMPVVAFDKAANRLGMGLGYYDATFGVLNQENLSPPVLLGLAYEFQCVEKLPTHSSDVPLAGIATEKRILFASDTRHGMNIPTL